jgi:hypothetical protein
VAAYKQTAPGGGSMPQPLYLRVRVYRSGTGAGVPGMTVTVVVQWDDSSGHHVQTIDVGATDANGYAESCGEASYALNAQLTLGTNPVPNPPGGVPAPGLSTITVQKSGNRSFC